MSVGLKYIDEDDKCYGITGMTIGMMIWDSENLLISVSLDASAEDAIEFSNDYASSTVNVSAKAAWNSIVEHYQLSMGMLIANVMCRNIVLRNTSINNELKNLIYKYIAEEGQEACSLEDDEIRKLFDKSYSYLQRIFNHQGVQSIVHDFARSLKRQRVMSQSEVVEKLRALYML